MINKIYTVMVMEKLDQDPKTKLPEFGSERLVGWYQSLADAYSSVVYNNYDIHETCYNYALIEECSEGLYEPAINKWWFKYNKEIDEYSEIKEPEFCKGFCGFTIG